MTVDSVEQMVAQVWADVLGMPLDGDPDFFELGGDSLQAMHVISRVRLATGANVRVRLLFECPQLSTFSAAVAALGNGE